MRSPRLRDTIGEWALNDEMRSPDDTSQSLTVESSDDETIFRPTAMMAVPVTGLTCCRSVRAGTILVPEREGSSGSSVGRIVREKSCPEDNMTRDDGKNLSEVTRLR